MSPKAFLTGATGFIGRRLVPALIENGYRVTVLTRSADGKPDLPDGAAYLEGDPLRPGAWQEAVAGNDAVVNLAGASIASRWTDKRKTLILESRLMTTHNLVAALAARPGGGIRWINASAVGYYGDRGDVELDENAASGPDFLAAVASQWETRAMEAERFGARVTLCRFGVVLGREGGALPRLLPIFRRGFGTRLGSGRQWMSWIHIDDLIAALVYLLERDAPTGPVNCTAPHPVNNREWTDVLNQTVRGGPTRWPAVPGFLLRWRLGEFAETVLGGQRAKPCRLLESGFRFKFANLTDALENLVPRPEKR